MVLECFPLSNALTQFSFYSITKLIPGQTNVSYIGRAIFFWRVYKWILIFLYVAKFE